MDPVLPGHRLAEHLGGKDPFERRRQGKRFGGNNWQMHRQPAKFNRDHLHHRGGNQVILLQKLRFLLWISITKNYKKLMLDWVEICECLMSELTTAERRQQHVLVVWAICFTTGEASLTASTTCWFPPGGKRVSPSRLKRWRMHLKLKCSSTHKQVVNFTL